MKSSRLAAVISEFAGIEHGARLNRTNVRRLPSTDELTSRVVAAPKFDPVLSPST